MTLKSCDMPGALSDRPSGRGEKGSIILIVLMLLVILSVIGISSTNTTITENYIVRNSTIRKQNIHLADAAAMEVVQQVMDAGLIDESSLEIPQIKPNLAGHLNWVHDKDAWDGAGGHFADWYNGNFIGHVLDGADPDTDFQTPFSIQNANIGLLNERAEADDSIRYALVGWRDATGGAGTAGTNINLMTGQPILRSADILTEYLSPNNNGMIRLSVGVNREFLD